MPTLIFDIGTTNIFSLVYKSGDIIRTSTKGTETSKDQTQNPKAILDYVIKTIHEAYKTYQISKVVISTAMHTLLFLDEEYAAISDLMLWNDNRSEHIFDTLSKLEKEVIYRSTGTPLHSMSPLSKLLYIKEKYARISDLKSYLMVHLTAQFVTDYSSASASGLWNLETKDWDENILKLISYEKTQLPETVEINSQFKYNDYIDIVIGATDGVLANRGIAKNEEMVISAGTSIGIRKLSKEISLDGGFCYYAGFDTYLIGEASNNGGNVIEWIRNNINPALSYQDITDIIKDANYQDFCIPYIFGERGPFWKDGKSLYFEDNMSEHEKVRALVYGILSHAKLMLSQVNNQNNFVYLTGGLFKNEVLRKIFSSMIEKDLYIYEDDLAVSYGLLSLVHNDVKRQEIKIESYVDNKALLKYSNQYMDYLIKKNNEQSL